MTFYLMMMTCDVMCVSCVQYMQKDVMMKIEKDPEPLFTTAFQLKYNAKKMKK